MKHPYLIHWSCTRTKRPPRKKAGRNLCLVTELEWLWCCVIKDVDRNKYKIIILYVFDWFKDQLSILVYHISTISTGLDFYSPLMSNSIKILLICHALWFLSITVINQCHAIHAIHHVYLTFLLVPQIYILYLNFLWHVQSNPLCSRKNEAENIIPLI